MKGFDPIVYGFKSIGVKLCKEPQRVVCFFSFWKWGWFYMWRKRCPSDKEGRNDIGDVLKFAYRYPDKMPVTIIYWVEKL